METVFQPGIVISATDNMVVVRINSRSACVGCSLKNNCSFTECAEKEIEVLTPQASLYQAGDNVKVGIDSRFGFTAAFYAYILPLIFMLTIIALGDGLGWTEISTGISAIIILIPYYLGLFLTQNYFKSRFKYIISKASE